MPILTDTSVQVIVSSIRTKRARCALYKIILDLLNEESISGEKLVYQFDEKSYRECLKGESIAKVQFKFFFCP